MKYYKIAPLSYIGKDNDLLTYSSEQDFTPGEAVTVPLRNKETQGIVIEEAGKPEFKTKEIISAAYEKSVLSQELLNLALWISEYYRSSLVTTLQAMIPSGITKKRRQLPEKVVLMGNEKLNLTEAQEKVFKEIQGNLKTKPHLLFGVTGSGKTEVYMQIIEEVLKRGEQAIVLVPEISLTPQTLERFINRFGNIVTILHSNLKETERFANWKAILNGEKQIVVGSRSAIFAPCPNLGVIVIDEEHDPSYKQDSNPKYDAIAVAEKRSGLEGTGLILGSATPNIESFYKTKKGEYFLHTLNNRIIQTSLPKVEIVDMRHEFQYGNKSIFSEKLQQEIKKTLAENKQILLFINRRGMSTFVSCRDCGHVELCPNCELPLTFHFSALNLECHHCGYNKKAPVVCPMCKSLAIKYFGTGTQKVEQEAKKLFGEKVKIGRMDADTTKTRDSHKEIYNAFLNKEYDILIGTQMITKGWDLANVDLVGIISADTAINFPDYTASERTFNLLTQVAGRTGRGENEGKVVIQTYNPDNFAIKYASRHDFEGFYDVEISNREELNYPPFAKLIKLLYNNSVQDIAKADAQKAAALIEHELKNINANFSILGPSPAFTPKLNNKYFYQITLKIFKVDEEEIIKIGEIVNRLLNENWSIDIDPSDLL